MMLDFKTFYFNIEVPKGTFLDLFFLLKSSEETHGIKCSFSYAFLCSLVINQVTSWEIRVFTSKYGVLQVNPAGPWAKKEN